MYFIKPITMIIFIYYIINPTEKIGNDFIAMFDRHVSFNQSKLRINLIGILGDMCLCVFRMKRREQCTWHTIERKFVANVSEIIAFFLSRNHCAIDQRSAVVVQTAVCAAYRIQLFQRIAFSLRNFVGIDSIQLNNTVIASSIAYYQKTIRNCQHLEC